MKGGGELKAPCRALRRPGTWRDCENKLKGGFSRRDLLHHFLNGHFKARKSGGIRVGLDRIVCSYSAAIHPPAPHQAGIRVRNTTWHYNSRREVQFHWPSIVKAFMLFCGCYNRRVCRCSQAFTRSIVSTWFLYFCDESHSRYYCN